MATVVRLTPLSTMATNTVSLPPCTLPSIVFVLYLGYQRFGAGTIFLFSFCTVPSWSRTRAPRHNNNNKNRSSTEFILTARCCFGSLVMMSFKQFLCASHKGAHYGLSRVYLFKVCSFWVKLKYNTMLEASTSN